MIFTFWGHQLRLRNYTFRGNEFAFLWQMNKTNLLQKSESGQNKFQNLYVLIKPDSICETYQTIFSARTPVSYWYCNTFLPEGQMSLL